jgi:hypothetical protein
MTHTIAILRYSTCALCLERERGERGREGIEGEGESEGVMGKEGEGERENVCVCVLMREEKHRLLFLWPQGILKGAMAFGRMSFG